VEGNLTTPIGTEQPTKPYGAGGYSKSVEGGVFQGRAITNKGKVRYMGLGGHWGLFHLGWQGVKSVKKGIPYRASPTLMGGRGKGPYEGEKEALLQTVI